MGNNLGKITMKKRLLTTMFCVGIFATSLILTSCGGGGESKSSGKETGVKFQKFPKNEVLGDLVNISCEYAAKWNASEAEFNEARKKNNEKYADNSDKREQNYQKISDSHKEMGKQIVADANAALEKEMATLNGKALPFECEEGMGFEVVECNISGITKHAGSCNRTTLNFIYKVKPTDATILKNISPLTYPAAYTFVDASGKVLLNEKGDDGVTQNISFNNEMLKQLRNGETIERDGWVVLEPCMANFAKIKFMKRD